MTLLTTISNLGGSWYAFWISHRILAPHSLMHLRVPCSYCRPRFFVFYLVDKLSCKGGEHHCVVCFRLVLPHSVTFVCVLAARADPCTEPHQKADSHHAHHAPAALFDPSTCWVPLGTDGFYILSVISILLGMHSVRNVSQ